ncbi:MAG: plastocyanin/azurin family copper-binding protein [Pseudomonadota bacterium]|nr:plastocyanin/azurin family copper-binding protein [Pseudomonadota bacterium]
MACATSALSANHDVAVGGNGFRFTPNRLSIAVGDTVTFTNAGGTHNVASQAGGFRCASSCTASGGQVTAAAWIATVTFNTPGAFDFFCEAHGAPGEGMAGSLTVEGTPPPTPLGPGYTGTWYDTLQSGHGIFVEILPGDLLLAYWFTFTPDGQQAWFGGVGRIVGNSATMTAVRSTGARFIPNFNPAEVVRTDWGSLTFTFTDCTNGRVDFNSVVGFGTGNMILKRLTLPAGLTCPAPAVTATASVQSNR